VVEKNKSTAAQTKKTEAQAAQTKKTEAQAAQTRKIEAQAAQTRKTEARRRKPPEKGHQFIYPLRFTWRFTNGSRVFTWYSQQQKFNQNTR